MALESVSTRKYTTPIPGVYSDPETAPFTEPASGRGTVGALSPTSYTRLKPYTPYLVTSSQSLRALLPDWGARFAACIFGPTPATEPDVGAPAAVYLVNAAASTRAQRTFTNGAGNSLVLKSRIWGLDGNKIWLTVADGTNKGKLLTIGYDALSFPLDDVGGDTILTMEYTEAEATTMTATVTPATSVVVAYTKTGALLAAGPVDSYAPSMMAFDGTVTVTLDQNPGTGVTVEVTITGTNKATGAALVEVLSFVGDSGLYAKTSSGEFSAVASIARTNVAGGWGAATTAAISGNAFNLLTTQYDSVADVIERINTQSAAGFVAVDVAGDSVTRLVSTLDTATAVDITSEADFTADIDAIVNAIGNDEADTPIDLGPFGNLIIAERASGATGAPTNFPAARYLLGGTAGAADTAAGGSWEQAYASLQELEVDELWHESTSGDVHAIAVAHGDYMHGEGRYERHLTVATTATPTKAAAKALPPTLNRDYIRVCAQRTKFRNEAGKLQWFDPLYTALRVACGAAGMSHPAIPLTLKTLNIADVSDGSDWTVANDAKELVNARLTLLRREKVNGLTRFVVIHEVSTWLVDNDPLHTNSSTVRCMNRATRALRRKSALVTGQANFAGTAAAYKGAMHAEMDRLRDVERLIKDYDPSATTLVDGGAIFVFTPENIQPVEPINFVLLKPVYARIPVTL